MRARALTRSMDRASGNTAILPSSQYVSDFTSNTYVTNGIPQTLSDQYTTTRASLAWDVVDGALVEYAVDEPMLSSKGLGAWEAATNELLKSNDFDAGTTQWNSGASFTTTDVTSIGDSLGLTAYKLVNKATGTARRREQAIGTFSANRETVYFIVEDDGASVETAFSIVDSTAAVNVVYAVFDWSDGSIAIGASQAGSDATVSAELLSASGPNGGALYLISASALATSGNSRTIRFFPSGFSSNTDGVIIHHAQHCELDYAHPPILTDATAVTKNADVIVNNAAISSWYNESEGTIFIQYSTKSTGVHKPVQLDDGADTVNRHIIFDTTTTIFAGTDVSSVSQVNISSAIAGLASGVKVAYAYKLNDYQGYVNGALLGSDVSGTVPTGISELHLGAGHSGDSPVNGYIQKTKYYNTRLTQADLVRVTS